MSMNASSMKNFSAYVRKIVLNPESDKDMNVKVKLFVKQKLGTNISLSKLKKTRAKAYNKVFIMLLLTSSEELASSINYDRNRLLDHLETSEGTHTQVKIISLAEPAEALGEITSRAPIINMGGQSCLNIPVDAEFRMPVNPQSLELFVMSGTCKRKPMGKYSLATGGIIINNIVSEKIIHNSTVNTVSTFFKSGGKFWLGGAHRDSKFKWRKGRFLNDGSPLLTTVQTYNTKINDFRNLNDPEAFKISLQKDIFDIRNLSRSQQRRQIINDIQDNARNYVSDIMYAKTVTNNLIFYFSFNYLEAIRQNSLYANLYASVPELLSTCDILSVKIIRRRVKEPNYYNKLTGGGSPDRLFDEKTHDVPASLTPISLGSSNSGVINFVGSDPTMDITTYGLYEYGIEMEILDRTGDKLKNISFALQRSLDELDSFLKDRVNSGYYDAGTDTFAGNFKGAPSKTSSPPWVTSANLYGAALRLLLGENYEHVQLSSDSIVSKMCRIGDPFIYGSSGPLFVIKMGQDLISSINEIFNNRAHLGENSVNAVGQMPTSELSSEKGIFKIQQFFNQPFDADSLTNSGLDYFNLKETARKPLPFGRISYKRMQSVINNQAKKAGNKSDQVPKGYIFVTPNVISVGNERAKVFGKSSSELNKIDKAVYNLIKTNMTKNSPAIVNPSIPVLGENQTSLDNQKLITIQNQLEILNSNNCVITAFENSDDPGDFLYSDDRCSLSNNRGQDEMVDSSTLLSKTSAFVADEVLTTERGDKSPSAMNLKVVSSRANWGDALEAGDSLLVNYLLETDYFNGNTGFITDKVKNTRDNSVLKTKDISLVDYQQEIKNRYADLSVGGIKNKIGRAPAEESSMVATLLSGKVKPENFSTFALKYGFIQQIEYLSGYAMGGGTHLTSFMKQPIWKPLTLDRFRASRSDQKMLLCRFKQYSTYLANFEGLSIFNYNEVFLLGNTLQRKTLPMSTPLVSVGAVGNNYKNDYSNIIEIATSYASSSPVGVQPPGNLSPRSGKPPKKNISMGGNTPLVGNTTYNMRHAHEYVIDADGNGIAKEWCVPAHLNICHSHKVINGIVQPAESKSIDKELGIVLHSHRIKSKSAPSKGYASRSKPAGNKQGRGGY
tara:strand:- start:673 stop:4038 length:3366 start_codon:yes stop_codon:yes gene_type:complete